MWFYARFSWHTIGFGAYYLQHNGFWCIIFIFHESPLYCEKHAPNSLVFWKTMHKPSLYLTTLTFNKDGDFIYMIKQLELFHRKTRIQTATLCCNRHTVSTVREQSCSSILPSSRLYTGYFLVWDNLFSLKFVGYVLHKSY